MRLWRPLGLRELALVWEAKMIAFPPRLPEQPIFYPVLNRAYAAQIARTWNTKAEPFAGYVAEFDIDDSYASRFKRQVVGVFSWHWVEPIAHVLNNLGAEHVWVVHGHDGLDELTTTGATDVAELKNGRIEVFEVTPADTGLTPAKLSDLRGGDEKENAAAISDVLDGKRTPLRDIAILNAAAALIVAGKAANLMDGAALAAHSIESGAARAALEKLVAISNGRT